MTQDAQEVIYVIEVTSVETHTPNPAQRLPGVLGRIFRGQNNSSLGGRSITTGSATGSLDYSGVDALLSRMDEVRAAERRRQETYTSINPRMRGYTYETSVSTVLFIGTRDNFSQHSFDPDRLIPVDAQRLADADITAANIRALLQDYNTPETVARCAAGEQALAKGVCTAAQDVKPLKPLKFRPGGTP